MNYRNIKSRFPSKCGGSKDRVDTHAMRGLEWHGFYQYLGGHHEQDCEGDKIKYQFMHRHGMYGGT